jgi:RNA polymerase sigma-70 factor (ECF subfamily)
MAPAPHHLVRPTRGEDDEQGTGDADLPARIEPERETPPAASRVPRDCATAVGAALPGHPRLRASTLITTPDEVVMLRAQGNDPRAFEVLYDRHHSAVYALALRILGDHALAADATQEAFISLWRNRARYDSHRGQVKWWLMRIARNRAIDLQRRNRDVVPRDPGVFEQQVAPGAPEDAVAAEASRRQVAQLLKRLPGEQRQVIELAYFAGLTHAEITRRLGVPLGTIKGRIRLAQAKLRLAQSGQAPQHTRTAA